MNTTNQTIYHCCQQGKDVNKTLSVVHYADTEALAIKWLEQHGGGIYRNSLHNFQFRVDPVALEIYSLVEYEFSSYSYDGIVEHERYYFFNKDDAIKFAESRNLKIVECCNNADKEATLETVTVN